MYSLYLKYFANQDETPVQRDHFDWKMTKFRANFPYEPISFQLALITSVGTMPSMLFFPIFPFRRLRKEGYRGIVLTEAMAMPFVKIVATSALISFAMAVAYVYHNEQRKQKEK